MATQLLHTGTTRFEKKVENRATLMMNIVKLNVTVVGLVIFIEEKQMRHE